MKIVTDRGADITPIQSEGLEIHYAPMRLTLDGVTYSSGVDIMPEEFYALMDRTSGFPTTSQATAGDFADIYRKLAAEGEEILSVHISSGLSGTLESAMSGAEMVPEAKVTFWDTKWLSSPEGWQVEAAAKAAKAGMTMEQILARLEEVRKGVYAAFTLDTLKYLIHGGRISHMKGLIASLLQIRPVITVDQDNGKYTNLGQERTLKKAAEKVVAMALKRHPEGSHLRTQLIHGHNPEMVEYVRTLAEKYFHCHWLPVMVVAPILGAHTGPSLIALTFADQKLFAD